MPEPTHETLAGLVATAMLREDRASRMLGMSLVKVEAGECCVAMEVREEMLNGLGTCHGGILFSLADTAFAIACNSRDQKTVAAGAQIDFLHPALKGDRLRASAIERSLSRRLGLYDVTIVDQHERTIALFRGKSCSVQGSILGDLATTAS